MDTYIHTYIHGYIHPYSYQPTLPIYSEMAEAHSHHLSRLEAGCLLGPETRALYHQLRCLLRVALRCIEAYVKGQERLVMEAHADLETQVGRKVGR